MPIIFYCKKCMSELSIPEDAGIATVQCDCGYDNAIPKEKNIVFIPTGREKITYDDELPECVEVMVAYDLSAIPFLGLFLYAIFYVMVVFKLGLDTAAKSFWLRKGASRLWRRNVNPLDLSGTAMLILLCSCAILFTIFVPSHVGNETAHNEYSAQALLRSIVTAQATYTTQYKRYAPNLAALVTAGLINKSEMSACTAPGTDSAVINGYIYQMTAGQTWTYSTFYVRCRPEAVPAGRRCFSTDASGKVVTTGQY